MKCGSRSILTILSAVFLLALLVMAGCRSSGNDIVVKRAQTPVQATPSDSFSTSCDTGLVCEGDTLYRVDADCMRSKEKTCPAGCRGGRCLESADISGGGSAGREKEIEEDVGTTIPDDYSFEEDLRKTEVYSLTEDEETVIYFGGETYVVRALVINEVDERVKFKIDDVISFGIPEGGTIILKEESDEEDELVIEVIDIKTGKDSTYRGPDKVFFRFAQIID